MITSRLFWFFQIKKIGHVMLFLAVKIRFPPLNSADVDPLSVSDHVALHTKSVHQTLLHTRAHLKYEMPEITTGEFIFLFLFYF